MSLVLKGSRQIAQLPTVVSGLPSSSSVVVPDDDDDVSESSEAEESWCSGTASCCRNIKVNEKRWIKLMDFMGMVHNGNKQVNASFELVVLE